jgi:hypothetical protein
MVEASNKPARCWRIRMTVFERGDLSQEAWDMGQVGVWYGGWSAEEWTRACLDAPEDPASILFATPNHLQLDWPADPSLNVVSRFHDIGADDWVLVYLRHRAELGLAQLEPGMHSEINHPLNGLVMRSGGQELFKYRRLRNAKVFSVPDLPDAYHLMASQGRSNVYQLHGMRRHLQLLVESPDVGAVRSALAAMPLDELVDFLGAIAWESLCTGYLTMEHDFIHTGLSTGGTLPTFDVVGRRRSDGMHIFAQCKKDPNRVEVQETFKAALRAHTRPCLAFYFAFGGVRDNETDGYEVITRDGMLAWLKTERGGHIVSCFCRHEMHLPQSLELRSKWS